MRPAVIGLLLAALVAGAAPGALARPAADRAAVAQPPGAPTAVSATPRDGGAVVRWSAPTESGDPPISAYVVTVQPGGEAVRVVTGTSVEVGGLVNGTSVTFTVAAENAAGQGPASVPSAPVTPRPPAPPGAPVDVVASARHQSAVVRWGPPASDGGGPVTAYTVTAEPGGATVTTSGAATDAVVPGLVNGTTYRFTVTATSALGAGPGVTSEPVTPGMTPPDAPSGVTVASAGPGSLRVTWVPPDYVGGAPISGYTVTVEPGGRAVTAAADAATATVDGLDPAVRYRVTVQAANAAGQGASSAPSGEVPAAATVPATTKVLAGAALQALTAVADDGTLTFTAAPAEVTGLQAGDVVVAGPSAAAPTGLLRTVIAATTSDGTTSVTTSPAALERAIAAGAGSVQQQLDRGDVAAFTGAPGVRLLPEAEADAVLAADGEGAAADEVLTPLVFELEQLVAGTDEAGTTLFGQLVITPTLQFDAELGVGAPRATFGVELRNEASVGIRSALTYEFLNRTFKVGQVRLRPIVLVIGTVPVVLVPTVDIAVTVNGTAEIGIRASVAFRETLGSTVTYQDGAFSADSTHASSVTGVAPTAGPALRLQAGVRPALGVELYGITGLFSVADLFLRYKADTTEDPWWEFGAGVNLGVEANVGFLDADVATWRKPDLLSSYLRLSDAGGPYAAILISPDRPVVEPGATISLEGQERAQPGPLPTTPVVRWRTLDAGGGSLSAAAGATVGYTAPTTPGRYRVEASSPANGLKLPSASTVAVRVTPRLGAVTGTAGNGEASFSWPRPADDTDVYGYRLSLSGTSWSTDVPATTREIVIPDLVNGTDYRLVVEPLRHGGYVGPGSVSNAVTPTSTPHDLRLSYPSDDVNRYDLRSGEFPSQVSFPSADVAGGLLSYGADGTITVGLRVQDPIAPLAWNPPTTHPDPPSGPPASVLVGATWVITEDPVGSVIDAVVVWHKDRTVDGGALYAEVRAEEEPCPATTDFDGVWYRVTFAASCMGDPAQVAMSGDFTAVDDNTYFEYFDASTPGWSPVVSRPGA